MNDHTAPATDDELLKTANRRYRTWMFAGLGITALPVLMLLIFAIVKIAQGGPVWLLLIAPLPGLTLLPLLWMIRLQRRDHRWLPAPIRLAGTDLKTRRRIGRTIRSGRLPAEEPDRDLGLELARTLERTRWRIWLQLGVALALVPIVLIQDGTAGRVLISAVLVGNLIGGLWEWRVQNRVRALLRNIDSAGPAVSQTA